MIQKKTIQKDIAKVNKMPEATKDGRQNAGELVSEVAESIKNPDGVSFNFGIIEAKAADWGWWTSLKPVWCGWYPCGLRLWISAGLWNSVAGVGVAGMSWKAVVWKAHGWYKFTSKLARFCGIVYLLHCSLVLYGLTVAVAAYLTYNSLRFESVCKQNNYGYGGILAEASWSGGFKWLHCSNAI